MLQAQIDAAPDGWTVQLQPGGNYRCDFGLVVDSRLGVRLDGNGATIRTALPTPYTVAGSGSTWHVVGVGGSFVSTFTTQAAAISDRDNRNLHRYHVQVIDSAATTVIDLTIIGPNANAGTGSLAHVVALESQHAFAIQGCTQTEVFGCTVQNIHGDFVYISPDVNVLIDDVYIHGNNFVSNGRQGISNVGGSNVRIISNSIGGVAQASIDIEPNSDAAPGTIRNMLIQSNAFGPHRLGLFAASGGQDSIVDGVIFDSNAISGGQFNMTLGKTGSRRKNFQITNNHHVDTPTGNSSGAAITATNIDVLVITGNTIELQSGRTPPMGLLAQTGCTGLVTSPNTLILI